MKHKPIRIKERKLGREKADGQAFFRRNLIEIDPRILNRRYLETLIHESLHLIFPKWEESEVARTARKICKTVWSQGYRRIYK